MQLRKLGNSDLNVTPIGIGTWAMGGGDWEFSMGPQNDGDSISSIHASLDRGINWIDTAAVYGLGHAEEIVGRALKGCSPRPFVFTKCGVVWDAQGKTSNSLKAASIRRELEASLRRLRTDLIDLYQIHWPQPDEDIEEGWSEMARLQREGKVRYIGVSNFSVKQMQRTQRIAPITSLQPPYCILSRRVEVEVLPFAQQNNIGVIAYGPMRSGLLTGALTPEKIANFATDDYRRHIRDFQEPRLSHNLQVAETLRAIGDRQGRTAAEVAIAWVLRNPTVTGAIVGVRSAQELAGVVGALEFRLTDAEAGEIEDASKQNLWQRALILGAEFWKDRLLPVHEDKMTPGPQRTQS